MILTRFISTDYGTFGKLYVGDKTFYTVEKPWQNNTPYTSCIPAGEYKLEPHNSLKYGDALFMVGNGVEYQDSATARRFACLIHVANYESNVVGCIGLGDKYLGHMVTNSRKSIEEFYGLCDPQKEHSLLIEWGERNNV